MKKGVELRTWRTEGHARVVDTSLIAARELAHEFIAR